MARLLLVRFGLALGLVGLVACQSPMSQPGNTQSTTRPASTQSRSASGPSRDLSQDEAAGGHILRKHVGQTDNELRERMEQERRISGASTYTDRPTAEQALGAAIAQSQGRIQRWLNRTGGHPNLVLDYDSDTPIGRTINRGEDESHACSHALVVLKYGGPNNYYVLTSYPECR